MQMGKLIGRLTKSKQELREPIPMHGDRAEEAERCGGAMLATEYCGKLCMVHQRRLGRLRNITGIPHPSVPELVPLAPRRGKNNQGARSERNMSKGAAADLLGGPGQLG